MTFFIIILVIAFIAFLIRSIKVGDEIKSNDRTQLLAIYKEKLKNRLTALYIFGGVLGLGILLYCFGDLSKDVKVDTWLFGEVTRSKWTATHYWAFFCTLIGAMGAILSGINALRAYAYVKDYRNMAESEYAKMKADLIKADEEAQQSWNASSSGSTGTISLFETPPPCPRCGSGDTKTSDDYKAKQGVKFLGGLALGVLAGQNPYQLPAQTMMMKRNYNRAFQIEKEYQCKCCGYVWKGIPNVEQQKQLQSTMQSGQNPINTETINAQRDFAPEQDSLSNQIQGLRDLLDSGVLTKEEFDTEMNKILLS